MPVRPALVLAAALAWSTAACTTPGPQSCPPTVPAPADQLALLPQGLTLDPVGTTTSVTATAGHVTVTAVTAKPIDEVTVLIQDAVTAAGYRPAGMDNEGFEAEVFFTAGTYAAGQALVRRAACPANWDVELVLVDPSAIPTTPAKPSIPDKPES